MEPFLIYLFLCLAAYLLGSIPFGLILGKLFGLGDIRAIGSGNIGATNMMRAGGKTLGALTFALDAAKGAMAVSLGYFALRGAPAIPLELGMVAVIGHMFPIWLRFKGGKGIATTIGVLFALNVALGMTYVTVWLVAFATTRISSIGGIVATLILPLAAIHFQPKGFGPLLVPESHLLLWPLAALILFKHKENIRRIIKGEEKRIGESGN